MKHALTVTLTLGVSLLTIGCGSSNKSNQPNANGTKASGKLSVITTFYPTQYFAQRIGGDLIDVTCPVPADEDPIFGCPTPE